LGEVALIAATYFFLCVRFGVEEVFEWGRGDRWERDADPVACVDRDAECTVTEPCWRDPADARARRPRT
jgi:hypothetical protein